MLFIDRILKSGRERTTVARNSSGRWMHARGRERCEYTLPPYGRPGPSKSAGSPMVGWPAGSNGLSSMPISLTRLEQPETLPLDGSSSPVFSRFCRVVRRTFWPSTVCCARDQVWGCRCSSTDLSTWTRARCMLLGMPMKLVSRTLLIGITLLTSVGRVYPQAPRSLSPAVATIQPIFPSWEARGDLWGIRPSSVAFPRLRWSTDIAISAAGLTGYTISRSFAITRETVPQQGLDRSRLISWGRPEHHRQSEYERGQGE